MINIAKKPSNNIYLSFKSQKVKEKILKKLIVAEKSRDIFKLVSSGLDLSHQQVPLIMAIGKGLIDVVKLFIMSGIDLNNPDDYVAGLPIATAAYRNNEEMLKVLMEGGAKIDKPFITSSNYTTPLIVAIKNNSYDAAKFLIVNGANVNYNKFPNQWTPIYFSINLEDYNLTRLLVDNKARLDHKDMYGYTPLLRIINESKYSDTKKIIEYLINNMNLYELEIRNNFGENALSLAILKDNVKLVKTLLEKGMSLEKEKENKILKNVYSFQVKEVEEQLKLN